MSGVGRALVDPTRSSVMNAREFEVSVAEHLVVLRAIAARLVGPDDAGDVVQEALLRAWRRWSTFDPAKGTMRAWLAAIVVDRARRHRRTWRTSTSFTDELGPEMSEPDHPLRLRVEQAVRCLPRRQREAVVLYYLADLSVEETARALSIKAGSVKAHLAAARARLKTELEDGDHRE